ncbi:MAG: hypothetical protein WAU82_04285, partial [Candidatus Binatus sp.]|uniref:hypothetical protein n=1 Tax=Candidatus Binatus sp. TaxID=2811406 RepID=UPI003BAFF6E3
MTQRKESSTENEQHPCHSERSEESRIFFDAGSHSLNPDVEATLASKSFYVIVSAGRESL